LTQTATYDHSVNTAGTLTNPVKEDTIEKQNQKKAGRGKGKARTVADVKAAHEAAINKAETQPVKIEAGNFDAMLDEAAKVAKAPGSSSKATVGPHYLSVVEDTDSGLVFQAALYRCEASDKGFKYEQSKLVTDRITRHKAEGRGACPVCGNKLAGEAARVTKGCAENMGKLFNDTILPAIVAKLGKGKAYSEAEAVASKIKVAAK